MGLDTECYASSHNSSLFSSLLLFLSSPPLFRCFSSPPGLPILLVGVFERDVSAEYAERNPLLYLTGPADFFFNDGNAIVVPPSCWLLRFDITSFRHCIACFACPTCFAVAAGVFWYWVGSAIIEGFIITEFSVMGWHYGGAEHQEASLGGSSTWWGLLEGGDGFESESRSAFDSSLFEHACLHSSTL
jgi:hypothetical protein